MNIGYEKYIGRKNLYRDTEKHVYSETFKGTKDIKGMKNVKGGKNIVNDKNTSMEIVKKNIMI